MTADNTRRAINRAARLRREIDRFKSETPDSGRAGRPAPPFTWEQIERQMADLSGAAKADLAAQLVSATRKQAWCKPPEMVLRELLLLAATLSDDSFHPGPGEEADPMT